MGRRAFRDIDIAREIFPLLETHRLGRDGRLGVVDGIPGEKKKSGRTNRRRGVSRHCSVRAQKSIRRTGRRSSDQERARSGSGTLAIFEARIRMTGGGGFLEFEKNLPASSFRGVVGKIPVGDRCDDPVAAAAIPAREKGDLEPTGNVRRLSGGWTRIGSARRGTDNRSLG